MYPNRDKHLWNLLVKFQLNLTVGFEVMLNSVQLNGRNFYAKIWIWPCLVRITRLDRIIPSLFKKIGPQILNRTPVVTVLASCLSLRNSLIANTFLQQHCMEEVTAKNFKEACCTSHLRTCFWMITTTLLRLFGIVSPFPMNLEDHRIIFYTY